MRQHRFETAMRGFDKEEVITFIHEAAGEFEHALRENERLRQEIARLESTLKQFRDFEGSLKNTLVTAQKVSDDMRENATQEAARLVREAEARAEVIMEKAQAQTVDIDRELETRRESAAHDAARIIREAEERAELLVQKTQAQTADIDRTIDILRARRYEAETAVETTIAVLTKALASVRDANGREIRHSLHNEPVVIGLDD